MKTGFRNREVMKACLCFNKYAAVANAAAALLINVLVCIYRVSPLLGGD